jgi:hypothetical protein
MSFNEIWNLEMKNPFNTQKATLYLSFAGNTVTGRMDHGKNTNEIKDVKFDGTTLIWKASRNFPRFLTFEFNAKIDGDTISGTVKSPLGKAPLKGTRISHEDTSQ